MFSAEIGSLQRMQDIHQRKKAALIHHKEEFDVVIAPTNFSVAPNGGLNEERLISLNINDRVIIESVELCIA